MGSAARKKAKKQWTTPKHGKEGQQHVRRDIEAGDVGIWATCNKGREGKCVAELKHLFTEYAQKLYNVHGNTKSTEKDADEDEDLDAEIEKELSSLRKPTSQPLFTSIRLDTQCLIFFKVSPPVEPVSFVHQICSDAASSASRKQSRSVKRLTPMTLMGKATEAGLGEVARQVLAPHFHDPSTANTTKKFAIRANIRNHAILSRDSVIKQVADVVGPNHSVDLKSYDLLILVEIYKNICGISVVGSDFDKLKKFNLDEIFEPTPRPAPAQKDSKEG